MQTQGRIDLIESRGNLRIGQQVFASLWVGKRPVAYVGSYAGIDADGRHTMTLTTGEPVFFIRGHCPLVRP